MTSQQFASMARTSFAGLTRSAGVALLYFIAGKIGLSLAVLNASTSPFWPPAGISVAALLLFGRDVWPGIAVGAFLVNLTTSGSWQAALTIAAGNTLQGLCAAWLVTRLGRGVHALERSTDVFRFAVLAGLVASLVSATVGVSSLLLVGLTNLAEYRALWLTWWIGDAAGVMVFAPAVMLLWIDRRPWTRAAALEAAGLFAVLGMVSLLVFGGWDPLSVGNYPIGFFIIPIVLWPAFRLGPRETAVSVALLSIVAVAGTVRGYGPYGRWPPNEALLLVQMFCSVIAVTTTSVAAVVAEGKRLHEQLERRVAKRTEQIRSTNADLRLEIAERERIQAELRASEARLLEAQAVAHVGSWEWDVVSDTVWWSEELYRIFGLDLRSSPATHDGFLTRVHPDDRQAVRSAVALALDEGTSFALEHRIIRPDGAERVVAARGHAVCDASRRPIRLLGTGQDVTERKAAEAQRQQLLEEQTARREAEHASRTKDEFLAMISHELRTPLNAVLGWAHMLSGGSLDAAAASKALQIIERNAEIQARLIDDLLDLSKFAAGQVSLETRIVEIGPLVRAALDAMEPAAAARRIVTSLDVPDVAAYVLGDPHRLLQIISNLLSNAVKFTPEGGQIRVSVGAEDANVEVRVSDNGPGIAPGHRQRVFEPFWQADSTITRAHGGLGLGLAIVRYLVDAHGGRVRAEAAESGHGASFIVTLPRAVPSVVAT
jgi:PAS domain S-box-containing protein